MAITKADLRRDVVPVLKAWLKKPNMSEGRFYFDHKIYTHAPSGGFDATVVYEGREWADDFVDEQDGVVDLDDRTYEIEAVSSYEISITVLEEVW